MILPIDTSNTTALCGGVPEPVTDFATGAAKNDPVTGAPLYAVPADPDRRDRP